MFEKLIEAARTCYESGNPIDECCIECCPNFDSQPYCLDQILKDCVEALTQSGAELKDKDYLIQQQADEIERLRRDVKKQQEKMIELAKKLPKRGEWKATEMYMTDECTACGFLMNWEDVPACLFNLPHFNDRCPNCGAMMEVLP
ncbi:MAG: hypothetical protein J6Y90_06435 [Lachnospiraceae bacterium]|nr:hypothetical protein [Lachnospiraceae bacterium]